MAENSKIEWTHHTFNPWHGCSKVSPGCDNCYAERDSNRFNPTKTLWGVDADRLELSEKYWATPHKWNQRAAVNGVRERVFCASMADVFDKNAPEGARERLWQLIKDTPHLDWLLLTKRIGNAKTMLPDDWGNGYLNVWMVISVVNQEEANRDIPKLLSTPAAIRGLSLEPLLGAIELFQSVSCKWCRGMGYSLHGPDEIPCSACDGFEANPVEELMNSGIDWVIVGGESGSNARPMHPDWVRSLREQCKWAVIPFFFKQYGEWEVHSHENGHFNSDMLTNGAVWLDIDGKTQSHSSHGLSDGAFAMIKVGKHKAGRLLDGVTHDEYPVR
jgi:protein gp37